jgi:hypothetical protein
LEKCGEFNSTFKPKERNVFKKNNYNLIWLPPAAVIPDNLGRNSSVDTSYAGKEVTAGGTRIRLLKQQG